MTGAQGIVVCDDQTLGAIPIPVFDAKSQQWWENKPDEPRTLDGQKFQILRWINKEEYPSIFLHENRNSPLVKWLNEL